jgi:hypothetical protein
VQTELWEKSFQLRDGWSQGFFCGQAMMESCVAFWGHIGGVTKAPKGVLGKRLAGREGWV